MIHKKKLMLLSALSAFAIASNAYAVTSEQELAAIAKILSLSKDIPSGEVTLSVVYNPSSDTSKADLDSLKGIIGSGYKGPKHNFTVSEVPVADIGSINSKVIFVTEGLSDASQASVHAKGIEKQSITVTTTLPYVENGKSVLGVKVDDSVNVLMHGDTFSKSGLKFDAAFKFMIKEI